MNKSERFFLKAKSRFIYKSIFKHFGKGSTIDRPLKLILPENISIGKQVTILYKPWLSAIPLVPGETVSLEIGDGCSIGNFSHIYATKQIIIEEKVLIADKVYISDNLHGYADITIPVIDQPVKQISTVVIGRGSWLGENVCIIGAKIGRNCVIGANSVVTKDIPDYCIAVGIPARVIKKYNQTKKIWEKK